MGRSSLVSPTCTKPRQIQGMRMSVCRLPILLLFCILPLLISALGEERNHEVGASSVELQAAIVKREAGRNCGKDCEKKKRKKKRRNSKKGKGKGKKTKEQIKERKEEDAPW